MIGPPHCAFSNKDTFSKRLRLSIVRAEDLKLYRSWFGYEKTSSRKRAAAAAADDDDLAHESDESSHKFILSS